MFRNTTRSVRAALVVAALGCSARAPRQDQDAEISAFLERYFATWSAHDLEGYGRCFDVEATIQFLRPDGRLKIYDLRGFLATQRRAQAANPNSRESATSVRIERRGEVATAFVRWRLEARGRVVTGTDCFLLARREGEWLVTALLVENDP